MELVLELSATSCVQRPFQQLNGHCAARALLDFFRAAISKSSTRVQLTKSGFRSVGPLETYDNSFSFS
jgi:hypothetical protein